MNQLHGDTKADTETAVAVTFPSKGLILRYQRPPIPNPLENFQSFARAAPDAQVISLGSVPAQAIPERPGGSNWASIEFVAGGTTIDVMGHTSIASLQVVAQSVLSRTPTATG